MTSELRVVSSFHDEPAGKLTLDVERPGVVPGRRPESSGCQYGMLLPLSVSGTRNGGSGHAGQPASQLNAELAGNAGAVTL